MLKARSATNVGLQLKKSAYQIGRQNFSPLEFHPSSNKKNQVIFKIPLMRLMTVMTEYIELQIIITLDSQVFLKNGQGPEHMSTLDMYSSQAYQAITNLALLCWLLGNLLLILGASLLLVAIWRSRVYGSQMRLLFK